MNHFKKCMAAWYQLDEKDCPCGAVYACLILSFVSSFVFSSTALYLIGSRSDFALLSLSVYLTLSCRYWLLEFKSFAKKCYDEVENEKKD